MVAASRITRGTTITLNNEVYVGDPLTLTNATTAEFWWRMGNVGCWTGETPSHTGTGLYSVEVEPMRGGNLNYRWRFLVNGKYSTTEGVVSVAGDQFEDIE